MTRYVPPGFGWYRDAPDFRDYSTNTPVVREMLGALRPARSTRAGKVQRVDLRKYFPSVYDQRHLNSCIAHACTGLLEYFHYRSHGQMLEPSRLFLYKNTRRLLQVTGDTGANLRTTLNAMTCFGMPPEKYWPYNIDNFDVEPDAYLYSFAHKYRGIRYVRLDARDATWEETLEVIKAFLMAGFPAVFGFSVPNSLSYGGDIPYRPAHDSICGGQAAVAVGFDDRRLRNTKGALLIRNSWGAAWGRDGYGWLPYKYVERGLAVDFWTLLKSDWLESDEFRPPHIARAHS